MRCRYEQAVVNKAKIAPSVFDDMAEIGWHMVQWFRPCQGICYSCWLCLGLMPPVAGYVPPRSLENALVMCPTFVSVESDGVMIVDDLIEALKEGWQQEASFEHAGA